jgi:hypothetical protein
MMSRFQWLLRLGSDGWPALYSSFWMMYYSDGIRTSVFRVKETSFVKTNLLRTVRSGAFLLLVVATCPLIFTSCGSAAPQNPAPEKLVFKGTSYSSADGRIVITMVSSDELEIRKEGVNLVCKYTTQGDVVRAVVNSLGTTQSVYYRITPEGLRDEKGQVFYTPKALEALRQEQALAKGRAVAQARLQIVGSWRDATGADSYVTTYASDGTLSTKYSNGTVATATWTIDGDVLTIKNQHGSNRLVLGEVTSNTLTYQFGGTTWRFTRVR